MKGIGWLNLREENVAREGECQQISARSSEEIVENIRQIINNRGKGERGILKIDCFKQSKEETSNKMDN